MAGPLADMFKIKVKNVNLRGQKSTSSEIAADYDVLTPFPNAQGLALKMTSSS